MRIVETLGQLKGALIVAAIACLLFGGCGESSTPPQQSADLQPLGVMYGKYLGAHAGRPPKDRNSFLAFARREADALRQFNIAKPEDLLVSPRDGEPLVVVYGVSPSVDTQQIVAHESRPVNGTRLVVRVTGSVEELDETGFQSQKPQ